MHQCLAIYNPAPSYTLINSGEIRTQLRIILIILVVILAYEMNFYMSYTMRYQIEILWQQQYQHAKDLGVRLTWNIKINLPSIDSKHDRDGTKNFNNYGPNS